MGADNSKTQKSELARTPEWEIATRLTLRALEKQNAELLEAQRLERYHREQKAQEEAKLKQAREIATKQKLKALEKQNAELLQAQRLERYHREQKAQEEANLKQAREIATQQKLKALEKQNAELLEAQRLERYHREQRAQEEANLKQARADWQREEVSRLQAEKQRFQEEKQQLLQEQQAQAQNLLKQQGQQSLRQQAPQPQLHHAAQPQLQQVPPPMFDQVPLQRENVARPLLQNTLAQQAQAPRQQAPIPQLPFVPPTLSTSKSVISLRESTSNQQTKVLAPTRTTSPSTSVQSAPLEVTLVDWKDANYIQETHEISLSVAENIILLFTEKNSIPFIARYRKDITRGMDVDQLRNVKTTYDRSILMKEKANALLKEICKQGQWAAKFCALVHKTKSLHELEWMQSIFKVSTSLPLEEARRNGLNAPAEAIIQGETINPLHFYVKQGRNGLNSKREVTHGIVCILADMIYKNENTYKKMKILRNKCHAHILVTKANRTANENKNLKIKNQNKSKYDAYEKFSSLETDLKPDQIWEITRGEDLKILSVSVNLPTEFEKDFKEYCAREYKDACHASSVHETLLVAAYDYVWTESIEGSICKQTMYELKDTVKVALTTKFVKDAEALFLTPPVRGTVVIGIHPGVSDSCKLAVVSETGEVLETETIHPHNTDNPRRRTEAERILAGMILLHKCSFLALGNGTGYEDTETFLSKLLKKPAFELLNTRYRIVDGTAASFYSKSKEASTEFPHLDINVVSAISIARRLQDPVAELVKIDSPQLCNAIRQPDFPTQQLVGKLNEVIMDVVSFVGVDVNTAAVSLLRRVAGLNESKAKNIVEWRKISGPFRTRNDLKKVQGICDKTFEQCAGFIRIIPETVAHIHKGISEDSLNNLDRTSIHPESYDTARAFLTAAKCDLRQFGTKAFIFSVKLFASQGYSALAKKLNTTVETVNTIVEGLSMETSCDIRWKPNPSESRENRSSIASLKIGDVLTGVVRSRAPFGLFVDVGLGKYALLHNNNMRGVTLNMGQKIEVNVSRVEKKRGCIGLTYIKCL